MRDRPIWDRVEEDRSQEEGLDRSPEEEIMAPELQRREGQHLTQSPRAGLGQQGHMKLIQGLWVRRGPAWGMAPHLGCNLPW